MGTDVVVTGVGELVAGHEYRFLNATGHWQGTVMREDEVVLGQLKASAVVPGMSGAPVRRLVDDVVVGVVIARYNSPDQWFRNTVWCAKTEQLLPLIREVAPAATMYATAESLEEANRLILGPINVDYSAGLVAVTQEPFGHTPEVIRAGTGVSIAFDLSNRGRADVRVDGVFIKVLKHRAIHTLYTVPTLGLSQVREYECLIEPEPGLYPCRGEFEAGQFLRLIPGELERLRISIGATRAGVYDVVATVRYSLGEDLVMLESKEHVVVGVSDTWSSEPRARARARARRGLVHGWLSEGAVEELPPAAERALLAALNDRAQKNRREAAIELGKYGRAAAISVLGEIVHDGDEDEYRRLEAIELVGGCPEGRATDLLLEVLNHTHPAFRARAAEALGRGGDVRAVPALTIALQDPAVLKSAAEALGDIGDAAVLSLQSALADPDTAVRREVVHGLSRVGPGAVEALVAALADSDEEVRFWALDAIVVDQRESSVGWLIAALSDPSDRIRGLALRQLSRFRDECLSALRPRAREGDERARDALARLDPPDVAGLVSMLGNADSALRQELVTSLEQAYRKLTEKRPAWMGGPEKLSSDEARRKKQLLQDIRAALLEVSRDQDDASHVAAREALLRMPS